MLLEMFLRVTSGLGAFKRAMGWLLLIGSLETQVFFAKELYKRDYIRQKRLIF